MAWTFDRDYLGLEGLPSRVGVGSGELTGPTFTFRIRDDDGDVYYHGVADAASADDDAEDGGLYSALRWAKHDAGATDLQVRVTAALHYGLTSQAYVARRGLSPDDWVSIYG